jgi:hypothetical protein
MRRALALLALVAAPATASATPLRYRLANGCYSVGGTPVRMQASALGRYLLYTRDGKFLAAGLKPADAPSPAADWAVTGHTIRSQTGEAHRVGFARASGCAAYPNADTDVDGPVSRGAAPWAATRGLIDSHMHWMAADMFGGDAHCGRAWHPYGIAYALVDCPDHAPGRPGLQFENVLSGNNPAATHDLVGWPTFKDWPSPRSLTHENTYYRWVERAYRGGLRLAVVLFFDNAQLCSVWPDRAHGCDEMASVRREIGLLKSLRDYVDAQSGGPGKGWFQIVRTPFQARRVINQGKLAVVMGIETSRLFDCRVLDGVPGCSERSIDREMAEMHRDGIRSLELTGKFDNALSGVAGDPGTNGIVTNAGNRLETGRYLDMKTCAGLPSGVTDKEQVTFGPLSDTPLSPLAGDAAPGASPVYPPPPHCNRLGLSSLGSYLVNRMADHRVILDPDHMAAIARIKALDIMARRGYSGLISSHSWSTPYDEARIYSLGGVVFPKASAIGVNSDSDWFVHEYARLRKLRDPRYFWGFGWGSDINGIAKQPIPRPDQLTHDPVVYPFRSYDGRQLIREQTTGRRTFDFNVDGVAEYGLYLDWLQELRQRLGAGFVHSMLRGPEAYLEMWERAYGVPAKLAIGARRIRVGWTAGRLLRRAGQPRVRGARVWRYAGGVRVRLSRRGRVTGVA